MGDFSIFVCFNIYLERVLVEFKLHWIGQNELGKILQNCSWNFMFLNKKVCVSGNNADLQHRALSTNQALEVPLDYLTLK